MNYPSLKDIDTLLLDMDGTLLDLRFDNHFWVDHLPVRFGDIHGLEHELANSHIEQELRAAEGTLNWYCTDHWSSHFNVDIMTLKREIEHLIQYRPGTRRFLSDLTDYDHLKVLVVTDAHPKVLALKQTVTGLLDHVDHHYCSHDFGLPKRDIRFWHALSEHLESEKIDFDPARTMMIDDSPHVLEQCRAFGIRHLLCVKKPDSGRDHEHDHDYPLINDLSHLTRGEISRTALSGFWREQP